MGPNWVKVYDKASVLRVETTINNPREFRILRVVTDAKGRRERRWCPMRKGVCRPLAQLPGRYRRQPAATSTPWQRPRSKAKASPRSTPCAGPAPKPGAPTPASTRSPRPTWPSSEPLLAGEHAINGFRNRDLTRRLYRRPPTTGRGAPTMRARLTTDRQAPRSWPCRQGATSTALSRHPLRQPSHHRRHRPPRRQLSRPVSRCRLKQAPPVSRDTQIFGAKVLSPA